MSCNDIYGVCDVMIATPTLLILIRTPTVTSPSCLYREGIHFIEYKHLTLHRHTQTIN